MSDFDRIRYPIVLRELEVLRVADVTPKMRRITLGGDQLGAFAKDGWKLGAFRSDGFDDHVKLFFPGPGQAHPVLPAQADGHLDWPHDGPRPVPRDYTVRRYDPAAGEIDIDFVAHPGGVASGWAAEARPGDRVHVAGPAGSLVLPPAERYLLVGDETALPAIARFADERPSDVEALAVIEVADAAEQQDLGMPVTWARRDAGQSMVTALRSVALPAAGTVAWVAAEASAVRRVRAHLVGDRGIARSSVRTTAYWRRGVSGNVPDERVPKLRAMADLLTPMAMRVGVTMGIPERLAGGPLSSRELAADCGSHPRATLALLRFLAAREILTEIEPKVFALTDLGEALLDEAPQRHLNLDSASGHIERAWAGLAHTVRTGEAGYPQVFGRGFWEDLDASPDLAASFDDYIDAWAAEWIPPAAKAITDLGASSVVDVGGGTGGLLAQLLTLDPALRGTLVELAAPATRAETRFADAGVSDRASVAIGSFFDPLPAGAELYVLAQVVHDWPDEQATQILRHCAAAAGTAGRVVLVERVLADQAPVLEHATMDLRMLVLFGAHERSKDEFAALAGGAGLRLSRVLPAGFGLSLVELTP